MDLTGLQAVGFSVEKMAMAFQDLCLKKDITGHSRTKGLFNYVKPLVPDGNPSDEGRCRPHHRCY